MAKSSGKQILIKAVTKSVWSNFDPVGGWWGVSWWREYWFVTLTADAFHQWMQIAQFAFSLQWFAYILISLLRSFMCLSDYNCKQYEERPIENLISHQGRLPFDNNSLITNLIKRILIADWNSWPVTFSAKCYQQKDCRYIRTVGFICRQWIQLSESRWNPRQQRKGLKLLPHQISSRHVDI